MRRVLAAALLCAAFAPPAFGEVLRVESGDSIADAIDRAPPGSVIEVEPGVYHEALTVDTPGITLRGIVRGDERPVLDGRNRLNDGVIASGSPFAISGFAIRHYKGNGVSTQGVDGAIFTDLEIDDTGLYGVYPVQSRNVVVTDCTITRIKDAAIYVGESEGALVAGNEVHSNVAGIEIENTNDAVVRDNLVYDNTAGILVFVLPGKMLKEARRNRVMRNWSVRNNGENFGDPEAIVGQLPPGIGILVMGADETEVSSNWVKDNQSIGIGLVRLATEEAAKDPALEPIAEHNRIHDNVLSGNGFDPDASVVRDYGGGADFAWDGTGDGNCVDLDSSRTRIGSWLRPCSLPGMSRAQPTSASGLARRASPDVRRATGATAEDTALDASVAADHVVRIAAMRFRPKHLTIEVGQRVAWINDDAVAHTVTSGDGTTPTSAPLASPFLLRGARWSHAFEEPGTYEYLCLPHLDQAPMRGATVTVVPDA